MPCRRPLCAVTLLTMFVVNNTDFLFQFLGIFIFTILFVPSLFIRVSVHRTHVLMITWCISWRCVRVRCACWRPRRRFWWRNLWPAWRARRCRDFSTWPRHTPSMCCPSGCLSPRNNAWYCMLLLVTLSFGILGALFHAVLILILVWLIFRSCRNQATHCGPRCGCRCAAASWTAHVRWQRSSARNASPRWRQRS